MRVRWTMHMGRRISSAACSMQQASSDTSADTQSRQTDEPNRNIRNRVVFACIVMAHSAYRHCFLITQREMINRSIEMHRDGLACHCCLSVGSVALLLLP